MCQGMDPPPGLTPAQLELWRKDGVFLAQLLDNSKVDDYHVPVQLLLPLRRYQQEGINWLAFLRRSGLHGILADDMVRHASEPARTRLA